MEPVSIARTKPSGACGGLVPGSARTADALRPTLFFCVGQVHVSGCGVNSGLGGPQLVREFFRMVLSSAGTAEWIVAAQALPRQDDECAQLGSLVSHWRSIRAWGSG